MIKSRGLNHINLNVSDIQRSLKFYQEAFGLEVKFWEGQRMVFLASPGARDVITLCQVGKGEPIGSGGVSHFGFGLGTHAEGIAGISGACYRPAVMSGWGRSAQPRRHAAPHFSFACKRLDNLRGGRHPAE